MPERHDVHQFEAEAPEYAVQHHCDGLHGFHGLAPAMGLRLVAVTMGSLGGTSHERLAADPVIPPTTRYDMNRETITKRWSTPPKDRRRMDRQDQQAAETLRLLADGTQALVAYVMGHSESWVSRQLKGASGSVQARLHQLLVGAAEHCRRIPEKVRAAAPLAGGMAVLVDTFADFRGVELRRVLLAACTLETRDQADEDVSEMALVQLLERLSDAPGRDEAAEALEIVLAYESASMREISDQLTVLAGARALRARLEEVARGVH